MHTLFDETLALVCNNYSFFAWLFAAICTIGTIRQDWPEGLAKAVAYIYVLAFLNILFITLSLPSIRYLSIRWAGILNDVPDEQIIISIQMLSLLWI